MFISPGGTNDSHLGSCKLNLSNSHFSLKRLNTAWIMVGHLRWNQLHGSKLSQPAVIAQKDWADEWRTLYGSTHRVALCNARPFQTQRFSSPANRNTNAVRHGMSHFDDSHAPCAIRQRSALHRIVYGHH